MKPQHMSVDRISNLPSSIIENILCNLPIQDAASTSILSRNWRYSWLSIPKLEFNEEDFEVTADEDLVYIMDVDVITDGDRLSIRDFEVPTGEFELDYVEQVIGLPSESETKKLTKRRKFFHAICQTLLVHPGPIHEFTLSMDADDRCCAIEQIILYLSRNPTLKKFTLDLARYYDYDVPLCIFALHQLTHLHLHNCCLDLDPTTFNGFRSLTTLYMDGVLTTTEFLIHLISNCPLLKSVTLVKSRIIPYSSFVDIIKCLRVVEHLTLCHLVIQRFAGDLAFPRKLRTSLVNLKSLCVEDMCFTDKYGLPFLLLLMRCSPNLEKIKLKIHNCKDCNVFETDFLKYSDIWLKHLNELVIENFANLKQEVEFVMVILAKSPVLKKVSIYSNVDIHEELQITKGLLRSSRASPVADIVVEHYR